MNKQTMTTESGRSMVEMLGTLAIIGVLSIGGIAGYTYAMNKSKANDILDGVSQRALVVSQQMILGNTASLVEYKNKKIGDYGVTLDTTQGDGFFGIQVSGVEQAVCERLQDQVLRNAVKTELGGTALADATCAEGNGNAITYVFNEALNGSAVAGGGDVCTLTADDCPDGVDTENCVCQSTEGQTCTDHTTNECGLGYYCQFSPSSCEKESCCESSRGDGVCTAVGSGREVIPAGDPTKTYLQSSDYDYMNWWSAYSWCIGNGMDLVTGTIAGKALNSLYYNEDGNGPLYNYFGQDIYSWTGHDYGDSCTARYVDATSSHERASDASRDNRYAALCE